MDLTTADKLTIASCVTLTVTFFAFIIMMQCYWERNHALNTSRDIQLAEIEAAKVVDVAKAQQIQRYEIKW